MHLSLHFLVFRRIQELFADQAGQFWRLELALGAEEGRSSIRKGLGIEGLVVLRGMGVGNEDARDAETVSYTHLPSPRDLSTSRMPSSA